jgi:acyl carrier protein
VDILNKGTEKSIEKSDIIRLMARAWDIDSGKIPADAGFNEFPAWDSMGHVSLLIELETKYNISIDYDVLTRLVSVPAIVTYLNNQNESR